MSDFVCGTCGSDVVMGPAPTRTSVRPGRMMAPPTEMVPDHCSNPACIRYRHQTFGWAVPRGELPDEPTEG